VTGITGAAMRCSILERNAISKPAWTTVSAGPTGENSQTMRKCRNGASFDWISSRRGGSASAVEQNLARTPPRLTICSTTTRPGMRASTRTARQPGM